MKMSLICMKMHGFARRRLLTEAKSSSKIAYMVHFAFFKKMTKRGVVGETLEPPLHSTYIPTQQTLETTTSSSKLVVGKQCLFLFSNITVSASINTTSPSYRHQYHFQHVNISFNAMARGTQPIRVMKSCAHSTVSHVWVE